MMVETEMTQQANRDASVDNLKKNHRHRSRSRTIDKRSRSRSKSIDRSRSRRRSKYSRTRSPRDYRHSERARQNYHHDRERFNPPRNDILAVFGLDRNADETDLFNFYKKYGCNRCKVIFDKRTGKPRGFGFVYFDNTEDASRAKRGTNGKRLLDRELRVDYSIGEKNYSNSKFYGKGNEYGTRYDHGFSSRYHPSTDFGSFYAYESY